MLTSVYVQIFVYCTLCVRDSVFIFSDEKNSICFANTRRLTTGAAKFVHNMRFTQRSCFIFVAGVETQFSCFLAHVFFDVGVRKTSTELSCE